MSGRLKRLIAASMLMLGSFSMLGPSQRQAQALDFTGQERELLRSIYLLEAKVGAQSPQLIGRYEALAALYKERYDEYSAMRSRLLKLAPPSVPAHGGPFPRIGMPGYDCRRMKPPSLLSRWLNKERLPELYRPEQVSLSELESDIKAELEGARLKKGSGHEAEAADQLDRLGALYCAQARFCEADKAFREALETRKACGDGLAHLQEDLDALASIERGTDK